MKKDTRLRARNIQQKYRDGYHIRVCKFIQEKYKHEMFSDSAPFRLPMKHYRGARHQLKLSYLKNLITSYEGKHISEVMRKIRNKFPQQDTLQLMKDCLPIVDFKYSRGSYITDAVKLDRRFPSYKTHIVDENGYIGKKAKKGEKNPTLRVHRRAVINYFREIEWHQYKDKATLYEGYIDILYNTYRWKTLHEKDTRWKRFTDEDFRAFRCLRDDTHSMRYFLEKVNFIKKYVTRLQNSPFSNSLKSKLKSLKQSFINEYCETLYNTVIHIYCGIKDMRYSYYDIRV